MQIRTPLLLFFFLWNSLIISAQIDGTDYSQKYGGTQKTSSDSLPSTQDLEPDTFNFHFFYPNNPHAEFPYQDTTLAYFQNHDPARQQAWDYGTLGNLGAAHFPYVYQPVQRGGFQVGFRQFDLYKTTYDDFAFYRLRKSFTRLYFTQGKTQQDTYTQAIFSRNFTKGINISLDFKRINHLGQFQSQQAENTTFNVGLWYKSPSQRYDIFLSYISNVAYQQENGSIDISRVNDTNRKRAISLPVKLSSDVANTAHTERAFHLHQRFLFNQQKAPRRKAPPVEPLLLTDSISLQKDTLTLGAVKVDSLSQKIQVPDSLALPTTPLPKGYNTKQDSTATALQKTSEPPVVFKKRKRDYAFSHHGMYQVSKYKFSDTEPAPDSSYYGNLQVDNRGLRYFIRDRTLENIFTLNTSKIVKKGGESAIKTQKDFFEVGLRHSFHFVEQEPRDTVIQNLFLQGRWHFAPTERLKLETFADFGLIDNSGDYHGHADLFFDLKNAGQIVASAMHQSYSPTLMEHQHWLSRQLIWKNNFEKTFETSLSLTYRLPRFNLELIGQYHLLDHFIFYNEQAQPEQYNSPLSIGQLTLRKKFRVWDIHLDNRITAQQLSKNVIRLPEVYSWHSLYYEGRIFKKVLNIQLGVDLRIYSPFEAPGYQPAVGQFYLQTYEPEDEDPYTYPDIDVFLKFQVKTFRFFVKQENLLNYFTTDFNYSAKDYVMPYAYVRFGVSWQFLD
jgi:Putative porin